MEAQIKGAGEAPCSSTGQAVSGRITCHDAEVHPIIVSHFSTQRTNCRGEHSRVLRVLAARSGSADSEVRSDTGRGFLPSRQIDD